MKKIKLNRALGAQFKVLLSCILLPMPAMAAINITTGVSIAEYTEANSNSIWSANLNWGGTDNSSPTYSFRFGTTDSEDFYSSGSLPSSGNDKPFEISISETGFLSVAFGGTGTPSGNELGITSAYNTILVLLRNAPAGLEQTTYATSHQIDSEALPDMTDFQGIGGHPIAESPIIKFHFDDRLNNLGSISLSGVLGSFATLEGEDAGAHYYHAVGYFDPAIVPEPSTMTYLVTCIFMASPLIFRRRLRNK